MVRADIQLLLKRSKKKRKETFTFKKLESDHSFNQKMTQTD